MASCTVYHFANANVNSYSLEPESITELRRQNERKLAQATAEDAANENERGLIKDYKRQYDKVSGIAEKLNTARQEVLTAERSGGGNTTAKKKIKKTPDNLSGVWQGKKASNPRPTVLERDSNLFLLDLLKSLIFLCSIEEP